MLTSRQAQLMHYIERYADEHAGMSPSVMEMTAALGMKSKSPVARLLCRLEERGFIERRFHQARSITIKRAARNLRAEAGTMEAIAALTAVAEELLVDHRQDRREMLRRLAGAEHQASPEEAA